MLKNFGLYPEHCEYYVVETLCYHTRGCWCFYFSSQLSWLGSDSKLPLLWRAAAPISVQYFKSQVRTGFRLSHKSVGSRNSQRLGPNLNTELKSSLLAPSSLEVLPSLYGDHGFSGLILPPGSASQNNGGLFIGIWATETLATLRIKPQKTGNWRWAINCSTFWLPIKMCRVPSLKSSGSWFFVCCPELLLLMCRGLVCLVLTSS